jgi:hypothetical protein
MEEVVACRLPNGRLTIEVIAANHATHLIELAFKLDEIAELGTLLDHL